jgi:hypothetical protein
MPGNCWRSAWNLAASRELHALPQNNGVTGFVAATGKSYLCEDTTEDPLYLTGVQCEKSLTVPLVLHDELSGLQRESPQPRHLQKAICNFSRYSAAMGCG